MIQNIEFDSYGVTNNISQLRNLLGRSDHGIYQRVHRLRQASKLPQAQRVSGPEDEVKKCLNQHGLYKSQLNKWVMNLLMRYHRKSGTNALHWLTSLPTKVKGD
ncbi:hypothetical protein A3778_04280 [Lacticaseibacillus paracasei]|nr:hypothetical protein A3778_04280 [Lacticaseibacillus paracasei]